MTLTGRRGRGTVKPVTELGAYVRQLRESGRLTLQELAQASGVPWTTIQAIETGRSLRPKRETLEALAQALGSPIEIMIMKAYAAPSRKSA